MEKPAEPAKADLAEPLRQVCCWEGTLGGQAAVEELQGVADLCGWLEQVALGCSLAAAGWLQEVVEKAVVVKKAVVAEWSVEGAAVYKAVVQEGVAKRGLVELAVVEMGVAVAVRHWAQTGYYQGFLECAQTCTLKARGSCHCCKN